MNPLSPNSMPPPMPRASSGGIVIARTRSGMPICEECKRPLGHCCHTDDAMKTMKRKRSGPREPIPGEPRAEIDESCQKLPRPEQRSGGGCLQNNCAQRQCIGCWSVEAQVVVFGCTAKESEPGGTAALPHVMCLPCFILYASGRIKDGKLFRSRKLEAYTINCPVGCQGSALSVDHFELLDAEDFNRYQRFSAMSLEHDLRIIWCPHDDCGHGVLPDFQIEGNGTAPAAPIEDRGLHATIDTMNGGDEIHSSLAADNIAAMETTGDTPLALRPRVMDCPACFKPICIGCGRGHPTTVTCDDEKQAAQDSMPAEDGSEEYIRGNTKPCPKCAVAIFKDGGCNHMSCSRCGYQWCWIHETEWVVGGECQQGHWSDDPVRNAAFNAGRVVAHRCTLM